MKIAILSTIYRPVPPIGYGGIERVVSILAEELVREGHEVILFAAAGSTFSGRLVEVEGQRPGDRVPTSVHSAADVFSEEPLAAALERFLAEEEVDVIHDWSLQNLFVRRHPTRCPFVISTCIPPGPEGGERPNLVACSQAHARLIGGSTRFVRYGLDLAQWPCSFDKGKEFIHIAKIARYKGQHLAILAALKARQALTLAGNVEARGYYHLVIRPLMALSARIRHVGEINGTSQHLLHARALIQTPKWFDAFPLVVLEALAAGTPVIALASGGIPEQIVHGRTGFLCRNALDLATAMQEIDQIDPRECRHYAEQHFSVQRMAADYLTLYADAMAGAQW